MRVIIENRVLIQFFLQSTRVQALVVLQFLFGPIVYRLGHQTFSLRKVIQKYILGSKPPRATKLIKHVKCRFWKELIAIQKSARALEIGLKGYSPPLARMRALVQPWTEEFESLRWDKCDRFCYNTVRIRPVVILIAQ